MAASNKAKRTFFVFDDLRIYDLNPESAKLSAVIGPDGVDPRTIDPDNLPEGFRLIVPQNVLDSDEDEATIEFYSQAEHWRESQYVGNLIHSALLAAGATGEQAHCDIFADSFDDLLDDLQCDVINFLVDRGYSVSCKSKPQRHGVGVIVSRCRPEQQAIIEKALEAAVAASKSAYEERAAELVEALRREAEEKRDEQRIALFDEAVELLEDLRYAGDTDQLQAINKFLAKVAKN